MADPRLVLIETSAALPGLLPPVAHQTLREVARVFARDPSTHLSVPPLAAVDLRVETAPAAAPAVARGMDLLSVGGSGTDVRLARGLLEAAADGDVAYLLGPGDEGFARTVGMEAAKAGGVEVEFVFLVGAPRGLEVLRLVEVMAALRHPETGCPWDLEQDHASLTRYLVEETYELLDAIESGDDDHLREELGDVLLQVMFHAQIAYDRRAFGIDEVATGIADKLVRRHPHVFADGDASTADEVQTRWDQLKAEEKPHRTGPFDGVPRALPALMLVEELQRKAERTGFRWGSEEQVVAKVREELDEVLAASADDVADEIGDLLQAVVALARQRGVEPELALRRSAGHFRDRVERMLSKLSTREVDSSTLSADQWLALWAEVRDAGW